ncbi:Copper-exporting P-type ATPase A [bacterium HR15]|nr:Copper-exporting P-type ATPase A [bacterium HR15]
MTRVVIWTLIGALVLIVGASQIAAQQKQEVRTIALKVSGLHCEGCVDPVVQGLRKLQGVQSAELEFKTAVAIVRYDEAQIPASHIVLALPKIPHAMGPRSNMKYEGQLMLTLAKGDAKRVAQALGKVKGVAKVRQERNTLLIAFQPDASVRYAQIEQAVKKAGGTLAPVRASDTHRHNH